ncbi:MAG: flagellar basal body-associated FliL family protein, partial [Spirochaetaceae bacterium]|nr:flagellar basal body-associated FliL family protein [Spirochaetaceae bacterium]
ALFLAGGTVYGLLFRHTGPVYTVPAPRVSEGGGTGQSAGRGVFTGVGRLRARTGDTPPATVVVSVAFPYDPEDTAFAEELASKIPDLRNTASEYFGSCTAKGLGETDEGEIKAELLRRYNRLLHLGAIGALYFNDFMVLD